MPPDLERRLTAALERDGRPSSDFDLNHDVSPSAERRLRNAGVLIGVVPRERGPQVILTKRSSSLRHHPGQIAFPGGKVDPGDDGPTGAALREAQEEVGLNPASVKLVGTLPSHETVTGFIVTPVLGLITGHFDPVPEAGEVDEVFEVPFDHVLDQGRYSVQSRLWQGKPRYYYTVPFGPYYVWGATARILRALADRMDVTTDHG